ncbi:MAG: hypothetical protein COC01_05575 [Bacteroidetes bacterium]|nr:hypothetical protein [Bacteroidia bacterium]MBL4715367.1 hypothetical protein [Bacteroidia bacterium]PCH67528.1 MAG: hypothetical protein COC01_05575 [Bacteroidota bacterium]
MGQKKVISIVLTLVIIGLGYYLVQIIKDPIDFMAAKEVRYAAVVQNLKDIRTAEMAYKTVHDKFTNSFDSLIAFVKNDSMPIIKINSNIIDDTTTILIKDTSYQPVLTSLFDKYYPVDSLCYVPYSKNARFELDAGQIRKGNVPFPVFLASASNTVILEGLDPRHYRKSDDLHVGSMSEATYAGNWE